MVVKNFGLYGITCSRLSKGRPNLNVVKSMIKGGIKIIQLREKDHSSKRLYEGAVKIKTITKKMGIKIIINDRADICNAVDADGVHIGQEDLPIKIIRKLIGKNKIIGVSTHNFKQAMEAEKNGADYIGIGPIYKTSTKKMAAKPVGLKILKKIIKNIKIPVVAIGGINRKNIQDVLRTGVKNIAMVSAIVGTEDITKTVKGFNAIIK